MQEEKKGGSKAEKIVRDLLVRDSAGEEVDVFEMLRVANGVFKWLGGANAQMSPDKIHLMELYEQLAMRIIGKLEAEDFSSWVSSLEGRARSMLERFFTDLSTRPERFTRTLAILYQYFLYAPLRMPQLPDERTLERECIRRSKLARDWFMPRKVPEETLQVLETLISSLLIDLSTLETDPEIGAEQREDIKQSIKYLLSAADRHLPRVGLREQEIFSEHRSETGEYVFSDSHVLAECCTAYARECLIAFQKIAADKTFQKDHSNVCKALKAFEDKINISPIAAIDKFYRAIDGEILSNTVLWKHKGKPRSPEFYEAFNDFRNVGEIVGKFILDEHLTTMSRPYLRYADDFGLHPVKTGLALKVAEKAATARLAPGVAKMEPAEATGGETVVTVMAVDGLPSYDNVPPRYTPQAEAPVGTARAEEAPGGMTRATAAPAVFEVTPPTTPPMAAGVPSAATVSSTPAAAPAPKSAGGGAENVAGGLPRQTAHAGKKAVNVTLQELAGLPPPPAHLPKAPAGSSVFTVSPEKLAAAPVVSKHANPEGPMAAP